MRNRYSKPETITVKMGHEMSLMAGSGEKNVSDEGDEINTGNISSGDAANAASRGSRNWWDEE